MPFLTGGYPHPAILPELIRACDMGGATAIEIGFPFSDPIADGPVISASMQDALEAGTTPRAIMTAVQAVRTDVEAGLIAMVSHSIVRRLGGPDFLDDLKDAGFDGFIIPDLDLEEVDQYTARASRLGCALALLIAPTTPDGRAAEIARACRGFIYLLARTGLTGEQAEPPDLASRVSRLRCETELPIAAGFGISSAAHVRAIAGTVDAAIVGSAVVRRLKGSQDLAADVRSFVESLVDASTRES